MKKFEAKIPAEIGGKLVFYQAKTLSFMPSILAQYLTFAAILNL